MLPYVMVCCLVLSEMSGVAAEVQFTCPEALSGVNDTSQGPCGLGAQRSGSSFEVVPGPLTLSWQDSAPRPGSSYRVSLRSGTKKDEYCILQDRIPSASCPNRTDDTGNCTAPMVYYLTVTIPRMTCDSCYLQITTIFPNGSDCLASYDSMTAECPMFYSCANIKIRSDVQSSFEECRADFFNRKKTWPLKTDTLRQNFSVDFRHHRGTFPFADGTFSYEPVFGFRGRVKYQVELLLAPDITLKEASVVWKSGSVWTTYRPLRMTSHGSYSGFMGVVSTPQEELLNGKWHIAVRHKFADDKNGDYNVTRLPVIKSAEVYSDMSGSYTSEGWLTGPDFDGPLSSLSGVITPAGYCLPGRPKTTSTQPPTRDVQFTPRPVTRMSTGALGTELTTSVTQTVTESDPVTKSHPDESPNKQVNGRVQRTRFMFVKSGSGSVISASFLFALSSMTAFIFIADSRWCS